MSFPERRWSEVAAVGMSYHDAATVLNTPTATQVYSRRLPLPLAILRT